MSPAGWTPSSPPAPWASSWRPNTCACHYAGCRPAARARRRPRCAERSGTTRACGTNSSAGAACASRPTPIIHAARNEENTMNSNQTFVIVGGGLAGTRAVDAIRAEGFAGRVTIVAAEDELPYIRPPLSKEYLQGTVERDSALVHPADWYTEQ